MEGNNPLTKRPARLALAVRTMLVAAGIVLSANHASAAPNYEFGTHERIIDIGYGVFATPMSVLGEVMRRDRILQQQAESAGLEFRWHPYEKVSIR